MKNLDPPKKTELNQFSVSTPVFSLSLDDLDGEEWIDALGFDGIYQVSNFGRVKTLGRFVSNGKSERWVKERIRKLYTGKDGRITMIFNYENKKTNVNLPALIYFSFYPEIKYLDRTYCVAHINKIQNDNRLENLILIKISDSHKINKIENLLPHLKKNNDKRKEEYLKLTNKTCKKCKEKKEIERFEFGRNTCLVCRGRSKKDEYIKRKLLTINTKKQVKK
jgi:DNA-binding Lrp family transcriptional regulator